MGACNCFFFFFREEEEREKERKWRSEVKKDRKARGCPVKVANRFFRFSFSFSLSRPLDGVGDGGRCASHSTRCALSLLFFNHKRRQRPFHSSSANVRTRTPTTQVGSGDANGPTCFLSNLFFFFEMARGEAKKPSSCGEREGENFCLTLFSPSFFLPSVLSSRVCDFEKESARFFDLAHSPL